MDLGYTGRAPLAWLATVGTLVAVHAVASGGTFTIRPDVLRAVAVTPGTTWTRWWTHLEAGFFHTTPVHLAFNVALFSLAFGWASQGRDAWSTLAVAYCISPVVVLSMHLAVVRPLAAARMPYAVAALDVPLVGFSVIAYAVAGMALAGASLGVAAGLSALVVAFELVAGLGGFTGPFIFVYHLLGFALGFAARAVVR